MDRTAGAAATAAVGPVWSDRRANAGPERSGICGRDLFRGSGRSRGPALRAQGAGPPKRTGQDRAGSRPSLRGGRPPNGRSPATISYRTRAEREDVAGGLFGEAPDLLRRHVADGPEDRARLGRRNGLGAGLGLAPRCFAARARPKSRILSRPSLSGKFRASGPGGRCLCGVRRRGPRNLTPSRHAPSRERPSRDSLAQRLALEQLHDRI